MVVLKLFPTFAIMLQRIKQLTMSKSDLLGISSSLLCLLHCLAFPVILSGGYLFNYSLQGHWHGTDYLFVMLGIVAVWASARKTSFRALKLAFWLTILVFSFSILFHDQWPGMIYISVSASLVLIALHIIHWRSHYRCSM